MERRPPSTVSITAAEPDRRRLRRALSKAFLHPSRPTILAWRSAMQGMLDGSSPRESRLAAARRNASSFTLSRQAKSSISLSRLSASCPITSATELTRGLPPCS